MTTIEMLIHELDAVLAEIDHGKSFDNVCYNTVVHVQEELGKLSVEINEMTKVKTGASIPIPLSKQHAELMIRVASFYLEHAE